MKVYRIEKNEIGPYQHGLAYELPKIAKHNGSPKHPIPSNDGISTRYQNPAGYCGFRSLWQLNEWFHGVKSPLRKRNFKLSIYDVDEEYVEEGKCQLVFLKNKARLIKTVRIP